MDPSSLVSSQVNCIFGLMEFRCSRKLSLLFFLMIVKVSSTNLFHRIGGVVEVLMACFSNSSINRFATSGLIGEPIEAPLSAHNTCLGMKNMYFLGRIPFRGFPFSTSSAPSWDGHRDVRRGYRT